MTTDSLQDVLDGVRPGFEYNVQFIKHFLVGKGLDMGCGSCPLLDVDAFYLDRSPQPLCEQQVPEGRFLLADAVTYRHPEMVDWIFSSHMVEDLATEDNIVNCLNGWATMLNTYGNLILLLPDMQGGRYPTVAEGGNPSHQVDVGVPFIMSILHRLPSLTLIQIDTIPHERSCTLDVVLRKL